MITTKPIDWTTTGNPYTTFGDTSWSNYQISADVKVPSGANALISGRANIQRDGNYAPSGYQFQLFSSGNWYFRKVEFGVITDYATGTIASFNTSLFYNLKIAMNNNQITAYVNGTQVATTTDSSINAGQASLATSYHNVEFDNLNIEPIATGTPYAVTRINESAAGITYTGTWSNANGSWQDYNRTLKSSSTVNSSLEYTVTGSRIALIGRKASGGGTADIYIDGVLRSTINTSATTTYYRSALYKKSGLTAGSHTLKVVVKSGTVYVDAMEYGS
jgi:hypothetical protein